MQLQITRRHVIDLRYLRNIQRTTHTTRFTFQDDLGGAPEILQLLNTDLFIETTSLVMLLRARAASMGDTEGHMVALIPGESLPSEDLRGIPANPPADSPYMEPSNPSNFETEVRQSMYAPGVVTERGRFTGISGVNFGIPAALIVNNNYNVTASDTDVRTSATTNTL